MTIINFCIYSLTIGWESNFQVGAYCPAARDESKIFENLNNIFKIKKFNHK